MWSIIGTAVQGRGHERKNIPVQDKIYYHKGEVTVIALADGAGSAKLSHYGAEKTVETISELLRDRFDDIFHNGIVEDAQRLILTEIHNQLNQLAETYHEPVSQFASTLLSVAIKHNKVLIVHLGDGEIGAIKNGKTIIVSSSDNGEYANSTYFTTSSSVVRHLKLFRSNESHLFSSFFLMSDGTAHSLYSRKNKMFAPIIEQLSSQSKIYREEILNDLLKDSFETLIKQKTNDDCSFIMMTLTKSKPSYFSLSKENKELLYDYLKNPKHCSIDKWDKIVSVINQPLTLRQVVKVMHLKRSYVKANLKALQMLGFVEYKKRKFHLVETSGSLNENE